MSASHIASEPLPPAPPQVAARSHALAWLMAAEGALLVTALMWFVVNHRERDPNEGDTLALVASAVTIASQALGISALAMWSRAGGGPLASVGMWLTCAGLVLRTAASFAFHVAPDVPIGAPTPLPAHYDVGQALAWAAAIVQVAGTISAMASLARARRGRAGWTLFGVAAALALGSFILRALEARNELLRALMVAGSFVVPALAFALVVLAYLRSHPGVGNRGRESWLDAARGLRLVRYTELARIIVVVTTAALGPALSSSRKGHAAFGVVVVLATVTLLALEVVALVGMARVRRIPFASRARGPMAAALMLRLMTLAMTGFALAFTVWLAARLAGVSNLQLEAMDAFRVGHELEASLRFLVELAIMATVLGVAGTFMLLFAIMRAGRTLGAHGIVPSALVAMFSFAVGLPVLVLARLPSFEPEDRTMLTVIGVAALVSALGGTLQTLRQLEEAARRADPADALRIGM